MTHGDKVKAAILAEGLALWRLDRNSVSARRIGVQLDMTHGNCLYHFHNAAGLHDALAAEAVRIGDPVIVPQLLAERHPATAQMTPEDKQKFLNACRD